MKSISVKKPNFVKPSSTRKIINLIVLVCVLLLAVTAWLWWTKIVMNPDRVLDDTIANSLKTKSVVKHVEQAGQGSSLEQTSYLSFYAPEVSARTITVLSQGQGNKVTSVTTETLGTNNAEYVRYTDVKGGEGSEAIDNLKELLGEWAKREQSQEAGEQMTFLSETLFNVVPIGNLTSEQQSQLLAAIQKANLYKYSSAEKQFVNKRPTYIYEVSVSPFDLVSVLQEYYKILGVDGADQLDPNQYQGVGPVKLRLTVDILSRQLTKIEYQSGRVESYSGHNLYKPLELPTDTMTTDELQQKLQGAGA